MTRKVSRTLLTPSNMFVWWYMEAYTTKLLAALGPALNQLALGYLPLAGPDQSRPISNMISGDATQIGHT